MITGDLVKNPGAGAMGTGDIVKNPGAGETGAGNIMKNPGAGAMGTGDFVKNPGAGAMSAGDIVENPGAGEMNPCDILNSTSDLFKNSGEIRMITGNGTPINGRSRAPAALGREKLYPRLRSGALAGYPAAAPPA